MSDQLDTRARVSCRDTEEYEHLVVVTKVVYNDGVPFDELPTVEQHLLKRVEMTIGADDFDKWAQRFVIDYGAEMDGASEQPPPNSQTSQPKKKSPYSSANLFNLHDIRNAADSVPSLFSVDGVPFIPRGEVCLLAGEGGVGKSMLTLNLAISICLGRSTVLRSKDNQPLDPVPTTRKVLLIFGEEKHSTIAIRVKKQLEHIQHGLDENNKVSEFLIESLEPNLFILPMSAGLEYDSYVRLSYGDVGTDIRSQDNFDNLKQLIEEKIAPDEDDGLDLIIIDPISKFGGPQVETEREQCEALIDRMKILTEMKGNPTVMAVHHVTKSGRDGRSKRVNMVRGDGGLTDGVRWVGTLMKVDEEPTGVACMQDQDSDPVIELSIAKTNHTATGSVRCAVKGPRLGSLEREPWLLNTATREDVKAEKERLENQPWMQSKPKTGESQGESTRPQFKGGFA